MKALKGTYVSKGRNVIFTPHSYRQFSLETSFLTSVYVRNTKLSPYNCAEDFRNVKKMILFIIFAQNIDCGYAIPRKTSFARQLSILNT